MKRIDVSAQKNVWLIHPSVFLLLYIPLPIHLLTGALIYLFLHE
jgi:hypothetical protein